jgi:hypothetical protein
MWKSSRRALLHCTTDVMQAAARRVAFFTFAHVLNLDIRFHLDRRTGRLSRILERGEAGGQGQGAGAALAEVDSTADHDHVARENHVGLCLWSSARA